MLKKQRPGKLKTDTDHFHRGLCRHDEPPKRHDILKVRDLVEYSVEILALQRLYILAAVAEEVEWVVH